MIVIMKKYYFSFGDGHNSLKKTLIWHVKLVFIYFLS